MWLTYLDESGNTGRRLDDPDQPVHWLVGVMVPEERTLELAEAVRGLLAEAAPHSQAPELHGAELFSGKGYWSSVSPDDRVRVYENGLALLRQHDCAIAHAFIDKIKLMGKYDSMSKSPHLLAMQFLIEKIELYLMDQRGALCQRAILIADKTDENEVTVIDLLREMQDSGQGVVNSIKLRRIVDSVHFVRSELSPGVQLADLIAYALQRSYRDHPKSPSRGDEALRWMLHEHVAPLVRTHRETWPA